LIELRGDVHVIADPEVGKFSAACALAKRYGEVLANGTECRGRCASLG
jgi:hypothetical protein